MLDIRPVQVSLAWQILVTNIVSSSLGEVASKYSCYIIMLWRWVDEDISDVAWVSSGGCLQLQSRNAFGQVEDSQTGHWWNLCIF